MGLRRLLLACLLVPALAQAKPDADTLKQVEALGSVYPLVVVVRPAAYAPLALSMKPLADGLTPVLGAAVQQYADPHALLDAAARFAHLADLSWDLDPNRASVVGIGEPAIIGPPGASARVVTRMNGAVPGFGFSLRVPAKNPTKFVAELTPKLTAAGYAKKGGAWRNGARLIQATVDGDRAVLRMVVGAAPEQFPERDLTAPAKTPAMMAAIDDTVAVAFLGRSSLIRAVGVQSGLQQGFAALEQAPAEVRMMLTAAIYAAVLNGEQVMTDLGAEFDDHALVMWGEKGALRLRLTSSLTPTGAKIYGPPSRAPLALKRPVPVTASFGLDVATALEAAQIPVWLSAGETSIGALRPFHECGWACGLHLLTRNPAGAVRGLRPTMKSELDPVALRGAQIAVVDVEREELALAVQLHRAEAIAATDEHAKRAGFKTEILTVDGKPVWIAGKGVDPRSVFETKPAKASHLVDGTIDLKAMAAQLKRLPPPFAKAIAAFTSIELRTSRRDRVLETNLAFQPAAGRVALSAGTTAQPASPTPPTRDSSAGIICLERALGGSANAFSAVAAVVPEQRQKVLSAGFAELEPHLKCAEAQPASAGVARELRALLEQIVNKVGAK